MEKDLFGPVTLSNDVNNLLTGKEAIKLGAYGDKIVKYSLN